MPAPATMPYPALAAPAAAWDVAAVGVAGVAYDPATKHLLLAIPAENRVARWGTDGAQLDPAWAAVAGATAVRCGAGAVAVAGPGRVTALDAVTAERRWAVELPDDPAAVAVDAAGTVYAAGADRVWACGPAGATALAPAFARPTGLLCVANLLFVATAGTDAAPGRIAALNLKTGAVQAVSKTGGRFLGLDRDDKCYYITLDAAAGAVLRVSPVGEAAAVLPGAAGCCPPAVALDRRLLVLPRPGRLAAYPLDALRK